MPAKRRKCATCFTSYEYCPNCGVGDTSTPWKFTFCSENCRDAFSLFDKYIHKKISDAEAKDMLKNIDISNVASFDPLIQEAIANIGAATVVAETPIIEVEVPIVEEEVSVVEEETPVIEEKVEPEITESTFTFRKNRRKK